VIRAIWLAAALVATGCDQGPKGDQGPPGPQGPAGPAGTASGGPVLKDSTGATVPVVSVPGVLLRGQNGHLWLISAETGSVGPGDALLGWTDAGCDGRTLLFYPQPPRVVVRAPDGGFVVRPDNASSVTHRIISSNLYSADGGCIDYPSGLLTTATVGLDQLQPITDSKPADFVGPLRVEF
jgi:hypothetical protein